MNILYNIPNLIEAWGGVFQYTEGLLRLLGKSDLPHKFFINYNKKSRRILDLVEEFDNFQLIVGEDDFNQKVSEFSHIQQRQLISKRDTIRLEQSIDETLKKYNIDIIHCPYQDLLQTNTVPGITTMHDVQEIHFPEYFSSKMRAIRAIKYKNCIDCSTAVIVSYNHVKKDLVKFFNKPTEEVHEVLLDMDQLWIDSYNRNDIINVSRKYELPETFLLYPAATWAHKNHVKLLEGLAYSRDHNGRVFYLVCTGHQASYFEYIKQRITELKLNTQVFFLGTVPEVDLYSLYHTCKAVVVPTKYEAGSFPLVESMLLKIPVICSNVTSLPATIGQNKFTFDPDDIEDVSNKIENIILQENYIRENVANSVKRANILRSNNAAGKIDTVYNTILLKNRTEATITNTSSKTLNSFERALKKSERLTNELIRHKEQLQLSRKKGEQLSKELSRQKDQLRLVRQENERLRRALAEK